MQVMDLKIHRKGNKEKPKKHRKICEQSVKKGKKSMNRCREDYALHHKNLKAEIKAKTTNHALLE